jgi:hypothetical protein
LAICIHIKRLIIQVYLERILRKPEVDTFAEEIKPHQVIATNQCTTAVGMFFVTVVGSRFFLAYFCI